MDVWGDVDAGDLKPAKNIAARELAPVGRSAPGRSSRKP